MFPEKSAQSRRPPAVTAASWFQLAAAGLIVVQAVVEAISALQLRRLSGAAFGGWSPLTFGMLLALAAWLAVSALGLRRGSRAAYWLSLAALVFPVLYVVLANAPGVGTTTYSTFTGVPGGSVDDAVAVARWAVLSDLVTGAVLVIAAALVAGTVAILTTGAARRFFA